MIWLTRLGDVGAGGREGVGRSARESGRESARESVLVIVGDRMGYLALN